MGLSISSWFYFFWLYLWLVEVPGPGIEPMPQQQPKPLQWQCCILNLPYLKRTPLYVFFLFFFCPPPFMFLKVICIFCVYSVVCHCLIFYRTMDFLLIWENFMCIKKLILYLWYVLEINFLRVVFFLQSCLFFTLLNLSIFSEVFSVNLLLHNF